MVGTSKILTVSYGTFSCTLEGFDDSFNTMKAIAEYFRGLASDDRYFGAEPPTPDAEMLAKIAEREISRRVDATMEDDGIVLRAAALTDQSDDAPAQADNVKVHDDASRAKVDADRKAAKAARKAEKAAKKAEAKAAEKAARLAKREARQAEKAAAKAQAQADAQAEADAKEQAEKEQAKADAKAREDARDKDDAASEDTLLESVSAATADASEGTTEPDVEETRDDAPSSMLAASGSAPENKGAADDIPAHPDADSVAAKLQRIRAVVGNSDAAGGSPSDDLAEQFLPQTETPDVADAPADDAVQSNDLVADFDAHEAEIERDDAAEDAQAKASEGQDMISRVMARHSEDDAPAEDVETPVEAEQPRARVVRMKRADFEKVVAEQEAQKAVEAVTEPQQDAQTSGPDFGLLDGADELDDYLEDSDFTDDMSGVDDADLAQDLKAIQEDASDAPDDAIDAVAQAMAETSDDVQEAVEDQAPEEPHNIAEDLTSEDVQVDDAALDRLMNETDAQMQEPEGSRRRDAIAQLKAAVAAKEAARQVGEPEDDGQDVENAFRNDLSEAVNPEAGTTPRPRPVVRSGARTERPRPAPLKLVAAQRVDLEAAEARRDGPVVPRRVAARKEDAQESRASGSFAEFADSMGATELRDLLEAAAAYTSFVEGADEFSRPQILRRVRAVASDDFKREDELRSFAELISAGRFTKVRNGRFQVADDSRFNPERQAS